jgi:hypothetical protein
MEMGSLKSSVGGFLWEKHSVSGMRAVKAVQQYHAPSLELLDLLDRFRRMVNLCIRVGLAENVTSMRALSEKAYNELTGYDVPTYYRLTAISKAAGILRNYKHMLRKQPRAKSPMLEDSCSLTATPSGSSTVKSGYRQNQESTSTSH